MKKKKKKSSKKRIYEHYPLWIVFVVNILMLLVYVSGIYILFELHLFTGILFLIYVFILEFSIYKEGCIHCCYYGKRCAFGRGKIAGLFFKKGNPKIFHTKEFSWKDFIPQILLIVIPIIIGIALLISRGFDILILIATIYPVFNWFVVNQFLYGKLSCPHCKQGSICCPALKFFSDKEKKN
jgi:hypothetical protein